MYSRNHKHGIMQMDINNIPGKKFDYHHGRSSD